MRLSKGWRVRQVDLSDVEKARWLLDEPMGVGTLVLAGSSGCVHSSGAEVLARQAAIADSIR
jgi:uncharacterized protein